MRRGESNVGRESAEQERIRNLEADMLNSTALSARVIEEKDLAVRVLEQELGQKNEIIRSHEASLARVKKENERVSGMRDSLEQRMRALQEKADAKDREHSRILAAKEREHSRNLEAKERERAFLEAALKQAKNNEGLSICDLTREVENLKASPRIDTRHLGVAEMHRLVREVNFIAQGLDFSKPAAGFAALPLIRLLIKHRALPYGDDAAGVQSSSYDDNNDDDDDETFDLLHPLSDEEDDHQHVAGDKGLQKVKWLIRHAGTTPLRCSMIPGADECISVRDRRGYYTSYVHLKSRCRSLAIKQCLERADGVLQFRIVFFDSERFGGIQGSKHFWTIAAGIKYRSKELTMETIHPERSAGFFSQFKDFIKE
jgi:hypothetical protein